MNFKVPSSSLEGFLTVIRNLNSFNMSIGTSGYNFFQYLSDNIKNQNCWVLSTNTLTEM